MNIRWFSLILALMACLLVGTLATLLASATSAQTSASLAPTPPMGWNSWNKFGCNVSDKLIREMADAVVSSGMQAAGYQYVNLADCVHGKGLKLGIYTDAGTGTCEKRPGSLNHEVQDAKTYASWGIDYVKIDWCNAEGLDPEVQYAKLRDALANSGRPIVFSICNWGVKTPWRWGPATGNLWRTTGDINDTYERMSLIGFGQNGLEKFAGPGHWNDPDMLEVGNGGMKRDEYRTHMALWALLAAQLLAGNDLRNMSPETKELLTNPEVLAVDQDPKGVQGRRIWGEGPLEIWVKALADSNQAVGLFNRSESAIKMTFDLSVVGVPPSAKLRDLLDHKDLGTMQNSFAAEVPM